MERQCCIPGILGHTWEVITTSSFGVKSNLDAEMKPLLVVGIVLGTEIWEKKSSSCLGMGSTQARKQRDRGNFHKVGSTQGAVLAEGSAL